MNIAHLLIQTANKATVLRFKFIGMTPSAAFVNAPTLAGDAKQLCLPCFSCCLSETDDLLPNACFFP